MSVIIAILFIALGITLIMAGKNGKTLFEYIRSLSGRN